jgi:hypothetical protein
MRHALRSYKCKEGFHQGQHRTVRNLVDMGQDGLIERVDEIEWGCKWHGCRCFCHPWFMKRVSIEARRVKKSPISVPSR